MLLTFMKKNKPYQCCKCDACFAFKSNLEVHEKSVHNEDRPHKCSKCEASFKLKLTLKTHIAMVHDGKKFAKCTTGYLIAKIEK